MTDYSFFSQGLDRWGKDLALLWRCLTICPPLQQFHISSITQSELSSRTSLRVWGEKQKVHNDIIFLLVLAEEEATGDRRYGLSTIWVNPSQARVHSMEEAVKELTAWVSSGPNWPYALVQLNKDTCHMPLLQKNQPTGSLPAPHLRPAGCLPSRVEWTWGPCNNLPSQVPGQWHKPNWRQICLPGDQHPATHGKKARLEDIAPGQMLCYHYIQPP